MSKTNAQEICTFGNSLGLQSVLFLAIPTKHLNLHTITFMVILPDQQERELCIISFRSMNHVLCCGMEWHFVVCKWFVRNPGFSITHDFLYWFESFTLNLSTSFRRLCILGIDKVVNIWKSRGFMAQMCIECSIQTTHLMDMKLEMGFLQPQKTQHPVS